MLYRSLWFLTSSYIEGLHLTDFVLSRSLYMCVAEFSFNVKFNLDSSDSISLIINENNKRKTCY